LKLKEKGRYYELPIVGLKVVGIHYNGRLKVVFNDKEGSSLDLHGPFKITQYNQTIEYIPTSKDALILLYDLFGVIIKEAIADKEGCLFLVFENQLEITFEDGPYENWHYTKRNINRPQEYLYVHGGVGRTTVSEG